MSEPVLSTIPEALKNYVSVDSCCGPQPLKTQTSKTPNQSDFARKQSKGHARARKVYSRSNFELLRLAPLILGCLY